jgi:hypothetical protein
MQRLADNGEMKRRHLLPILGAGAVIAVLGLSSAALVASAARSAAPSAGRLSQASGLPPFASGVYAVSANGHSCTWNVKVTGSKISGTMPCAGEAPDPLFGTVVQGTSIKVTRDCHVRVPPDCRQVYVVTDSKNGVMTGTFTANAAGGGPGAFAFTVTIAAGAFAWPALPSGEVPLATVANGCGPGTASSDPRWGDTSVYSGKHLVNFRMACNLHDAGYSGAKVKDPLHGNRVVDYFTWSQARVDDKFLADMREICVDRIRPGTPSATEALAQCKGRGGTLTIGAVSRYNAVRTVGKWVYLDRPHLGGVWTNEADPTEPALALTQVVRTVRGSWRGGKADPGSRAEFRGTLISRDTDSIVRGYVKYTDGTGAVSLKTMTITVDPESPNRIVVAGPGSISGAKLRD